MALKLLAIAFAGLAFSPAVNPPSAPGQWKQIGAAVTSKPGKALHVYRCPGCGP
ncbi:MAG TPA: hypothetical protein VFM96_16140 [Gaiellaceae bacterium]|nr:hypothetical protein [Gaiellaceae bacterium]